MAALLRSVPLDERVADGHNRTGAEESSSKAAGDRVYSCRMCRRAIFTEGDVETHEVAQQSFHRRKSKGVSSTTVCSSVFLGEPLSWMEQQTQGVEGKLSCPNRKCGARLGSIKWTGAQCSCGSWVTPAIQFPKKNLDIQSAGISGPPPGTVIHASILGTLQGRDDTMAVRTNDLGDEGLRTDTGVGDDEYGK